MDCKLSHTELRGNCNITDYELRKGLCWEQWRLVHLVQLEQRRKSPTVPMERWPGHPVGQAVWLNSSEGTQVPLHYTFALRRKWLCCRKYRHTPAARCQALSWGHVELQASLLAEKPPILWEAEFGHSISPPATGSPQDWLNHCRGHAERAPQVVCRHLFPLSQYDPWKFTQDWKSC